MLHIFYWLWQLALYDTNQAKCINEIRALNWKLKFLAICFAIGVDYRKKIFAWFLIIFYVHW